jgi:uncharacterized membrane protein
MKLLLLILMQSVVALLIQPRIFWPYFAGTVILVIGLARIIRMDAGTAHGIEKTVVFGPLFLAMPMAVFGTDHFIAPRFVATLVPSWIPWHLFWVYLVGIALIASALSIVTKKFSVLAAALLSAMLFSFVVLISVPNLAANLRDRFVLAVLLRDWSFSAGALACAVAQAEEWPKGVRNWLRILVRYVIALSTVVFGLEHFLHPEFVPVVPLKQLLPSWIPGHLFLAYLTGTILIACGLSLGLNWKARLGAIWLGIVVFLMVLLVYLPIMIANFSDVGNGLNYFADTLAFSGAALLLAGALPSEACAEVPTERRSNFVAGANAFQRHDI